jgi:hypothetical protein
MAPPSRREDRRAATARGHGGYWVTLFDRRSTRASSARLAPASTWIPTTRRSSSSTAVDDWTACS